MNKKCYLLFFLVIIFNANLPCEESKKDSIKVLVIPFENTAGFHLDYINDIIQNSIFSYLKMTQDSPVNPNQLKEYLKNKNYKQGDLQNLNTLFKMAKDFNVTTIIQGKYYEEDKFIIIDFDVIDVKSEKIIYRFNKFGKSGFYILNSLNTIVKSMVEDFTGIKLDLAVIDINSDHECDVYVDDEYFGRTPVKKDLLTGKHNIKIYYEDENKKNCILNKEINLVINEIFKLDVNVFVYLKIDAEKTCDVFIENKLLGTTPFVTKIYSGNIYNLRLSYKEDGNIIIVNDGEISTVKMEEVDLYFPNLCNLKIDAGDNPFIGEINNEKMDGLPFVSNEMNPGKYNIKLYIEDYKWKKKMIFYDKNIFLHPYKGEIIDLSKFEYKKMYGLCFIPGASQFYNRQYIKGSFLLSFFVVSAVIASFSPLFAYIHYYNDYLPKANDWNKYGSNSNYSLDDLNNSIYTSDIIFQGFLIGGLISSLIFFISSLIDGVININRIYNIFYPKKDNEKTVSIKITPIINIGLGEKL